MNATQLQNYLESANSAYRSGQPIITDDEYDRLMREGAEQYPTNTWFNQQEVESEPITGKTVSLPAPMLSTNKAYSHKEIEKWIEDVLKVASQMRMGKSEVWFRITPKLDGFAAYDDDITLYTRGNGRQGTDITRAVGRGLSIANRGQGAGEIVVEKGYFTEVLAEHFENTRNIIAGVIKEGELDPLIKEAILDGAIHFKPFSSLNGWTRCSDDLLEELENMWEANLKTCKFDTDGLVIEAIHPAIKEAMGATNHHHRWQIAYKKNTEYHDIKVTGLVWQTSKNGRLTPVVQLEPTKVSGVTISKATGHHYGNVKDKGIDTGAIVRVCRSGLVIPYIESVTKTCAGNINTPFSCPSCGADTEVDGDNLLCTNTFDCPAQIEGMIEFFFKTLGNCDGFGPKVIERICERGARSVLEIYQATAEDLIACGFGEKTAWNLFDELVASMSRPIEDWRFLAAFSIHNVGKGGCEKLLKHHRLADIWTLTADEIMAIDGFAQKTADSLVKSLKNIKPMFDVLMGIGFNLIETDRKSVV